MIAQTAVVCRCCRHRIWLTDQRGSVQTLGQKLDNVIRQVFGG